MFNFIFSLSVNPSCVCLNVCRNQAFLAAKSNKGYIYIYINANLFVSFCKVDVVPLVVVEAFIRRHFEFVLFHISAVCDNENESSVL